MRRKIIAIYAVSFLLIFLPGQIFAQENIDSLEELSINCALRGAIEYIDIQKRIFKIEITEKKSKGEYTKVDQKKYADLLKICSQTDKILKKASLLFKQKKYKETFKKLSVAKEILSPYLNFTCFGEAAELVDKAISNINLICKKNKKISQTKTPGLIFSAGFFLA